MRNTLAIIFVLVLLVCAACGQTTNYVGTNTTIRKISEIPEIYVMSDNDKLVVNQAADTNIYPTGFTTRTVTWSNIVGSLSTKEITTTNLLVVNNMTVSDGVVHSLYMALRNGDLYIWCMPLDVGPFVLNTNGNIGFGINATTAGFSAPTFFTNGATVNGTLSSTNLDARLAAVTNSPTFLGVVTSTNLAARLAATTNNPTFLGTITSTNLDARLAAVNGGGSSSNQVLPILVGITTNFVATTNHNTLFFRMQNSLNLICELPTNAPDGFRLSVNVRDPEANGTGCVVTNTIGYIYDATSDATATYTITAGIGGAQWVCVGSTLACVGTNWYIVGSVGRYSP